MRTRRLFNQPPPAVARLFGGGMNTVVVVGLVSLVVALAAVYARKVLDTSQRPETVVIPNDDQPR